MHLEGNVRHNPTLAGTTYNVFGIQVGVGITLAIRSAKHRKKGVRFIRMDKLLRKEEKLALLANMKSISGPKWKKITPDENCTWLIPANGSQFASFLSIGNKAAKSGRDGNPATIFKVFSVGVKTNRDEVVYDFRADVLAERVQSFIEAYNAELDRYNRQSANVNVDDFVRYEKIKWSRDLKLDLQRGNQAVFDRSKVRSCLFRPFCKRFLFFDRILNEEIYVFPHFLPKSRNEAENRIISVSDIAFRAESFSVMISNLICDLHLCATTDAHQCFPFYVYDEDGTNRRENITDWALEQFRTHYGDKKISKWDIFYYVYGLLHHPGYRTKFADNLKRELPRIPFAADFRAFAAAGKELAVLHLDYEKLEPYPLKWIETEGVPLSYRVEDKMRLTKDKTALRVNPSLTLAGIPPETFEYRLGNRSALDWVIDQYQVYEDPRSGIRSDPNRADDEEYIVRLVGQVVRVSLETVKIVNGLPPAYAS